MWSGSRTVGTSSATPNRSVTTYWWRIGTIGSARPASAPTVREAAPAAITPVSAAVGPAPAPPRGGGAPPPRCPPPPPPPRPHVDPRDPHAGLERRGGARHER